MTKNQLTDVGVAVGAIWLSVLTISVFAPDMVSGSEQQHMPVAAFTAWIFGLWSTQVVLSGWLRSVRAGAAEADTPTTHLVHRAFAYGASAVWLVAAAVAVLAPEMVTGSDPTRIPTFAILAPVVAAIVTKCAAELARTVVEESRSATPTYS